MQKARFYRAPKPPQKSEKKLERPKPEWTTDFSDPQKYKLSETEMIQRKAALQSKNRELGRQTLEERRRKLEMGIVDQDTRKVYQTALTSKRIDLNPSVRRNLSQMIQYQKEKRSEILNAYQQENGQEREKQHSDDDFDLDGQVKEVERFIKKLEKAKKQTSIEKAVNILTDDKTSTHFGPNKKSSSNSNNAIAANNTKFSNNTINNIYNPSTEIEQKSPEQALSSIEDTIKYMQQKLFNPKAKKTSSDQCILESERLPQSQNLPLNIDCHDSFSTVHRNPEKTGSNTIFYDQNIFQRSGQGDTNSYNQFMAFPTEGSGNGQQNNSKKLSLEEELDSLKIHLDEPSVDPHPNEEDDCMSTIRRMRLMIGEQECISHAYENSNKLKENDRKTDNKLAALISAHDSSGDVEVDFSLTANEEEDDDYYIQHQKNNCKDEFVPQKFSMGTEYEQVKKNLFQEVDKLSNFKMSNLQAKSFSQDRNSSEVTGSFAYSLEQQQEDEDHPQTGSAEPAVPKTSMKKRNVKFADTNNQLEELKGMISGNRTNIQKIKIEPIGNGAAIMGFDYRGSINIRKNGSNKASS